MILHLVPILLCEGERLFEGLGESLHGLRLEETIVAPEVTHFRFTR